MGSWEHFWRFFDDLWKNGRSVKTTNTPSLLVVFWGLGPPLESPGGCLGSVLGAMLEDVGSKMVFSWLYLAMFGHLGAKVGEQGRKMQQMTEKVGFLEAWRGEGVMQTQAMDLGYPPLRNSKGRGWSSHLHLELPTQPGNS